MAQRSITVRFSVQDAEKVRAALQSVGDKGEEVIRKIDRASAAQPGLKALDKGVDDVKESLRDLAGEAGPVGSVLASLGPAGLVAAAGIGATVGFLVEAVKAAGEAEQAQLRLQGVLKATGNSAGISAKGLADFADELEHGTLAVAEDVKRAAGVLATFDAVSGESFKKTLALAQDYVAVYGGDLTSATQQFGKALADPVRGMDSLRRSIGPLTSQQRELITNFAESGDRASAQAVILQALEDRIGGAGGAEAGGLVGATHRLNTAWGDLQKAFGNELTQPTTAALNLLAQALDLVAKNTDKIGPALAKLAGFASSFLPVVGLVTGPGNINDLIIKPAEKKLGIDLFNANQFPSWLTNLNLFNRDQFSAVLGPRPTPPANLDSLQRLVDDVSSSASGGGAASLQAMRDQIQAADALVLSLDGLARARQDIAKQQSVLHTALADTYSQLSAGSISVDEAAAKIKEYTDAAAKLGVVLSETRDAAGQFFKAQEDQLKLAGLTGVARAQAQAELTLTNQLKSTDHRAPTPDEIAKARSNAATGYYKDQAGGVADSVQQLNLQAAGLQKVAQAYAVSTEAGEKAELQLRAEIDARHAGAKSAAELYAAYLKEYEGKKLVDSVKLVEQTNLEADAAEKLAAAAAKGPEEYRRVTIELEVAKKSQDGFFKDGIVSAEDYASGLKRIDVANIARQWSLATNDLKDQNELLALQLQMVGQAPSLVAKEVALLQVKQQALKEGLSLESQQYRDRAAAVSAMQDYTAALAAAHQQEEELQGPIRDLVHSIQDDLAGAFASAFSKSGIKAKSLFKTMVQQAIAAASQIEAALTMRALISLVVNATGTQNSSLAASLGYYAGGGATASGGGGFVDQSALSRLLGGSGIGGVGSGAGGSSSGGGGLLGGGGLSGNLPGGSLLNLGGGGSILNQSLAVALGGFSSGLSGASAGIANAAGAVGSTGWLGATSVGSALGALGGGLGGILQIAQGNTIGGIASILGAGVSLIPGVGWIAGPLIALAGSLLGGLFKKKPPHANAQLLTAAPGTITAGPTTPFQGTDFTYDGPFGVLGYKGSGTNDRFDDPEGAAGDLLKAINTIDKAVASLLTDSQIAKVSTALQSTPALQTDFKKFDNEGFDIELDRLQTEFKALYGGSVANKAFDDIERGNDHIQDLAQRAADVINFANSVDALGKSVTDAETAVTAIKDQFAQLKSQATDYGFGDDTLDKIDQQQKDALNKVVSDFNDTVTNGLLAIDDPNALALQTLAADQAKRLANAEYLNDQYAQHIVDNQVDINKLEELFGKERTQLVQQQLAAIGTSWRDFFDELTLGPLSSLSPSDQHAQAIGRYQDIVAQLGDPANANDPALLAQYQDAARTALAAERAYSGAGGATAALYDDILAFVRAQGNIPGFAGGGVAQGLAWVGERGPELAYFAQPTRIFDANTSANVVRLNGTGGRGVGDIAALRDEVRGLRADMARLLTAIASGNTQLVQAFLQQAAAQNRMANETRAANTRRAAAGR